MWFGATVHRRVPAGVDRGGSVRRDGMPEVLPRAPGLRSCRLGRAPDTLSTKNRAYSVGWTTPSLGMLCVLLRTPSRCALEQHLNGVKKLYVVAVDQMAGIPVELLNDRYVVSYVPSGTFLARLKEEPAGRLISAGVRRSDLRSIRQESGAPQGRFRPADS